MFDDFPFLFAAALVCGPGLIVLWVFALGFGERREAERRREREAHDFTVEDYLRITSRGQR